MDPNLPVDVATVKERVSSLEDQPRFQTVLVSLFAVTGLAMAVIGLYGILSFLVAGLGYIGYRWMSRGERIDRKAALATIAGA